MANSFIKMEEKNRLNAVCFGEVLWDFFSTGKKIGGAPLNVAFRLNSFGIKTTIISCVGKDKNGQEIFPFLQNQNINADFIQISDKYPTGVVDVKIGNKGNASYDIVYPSAWDKIAKTEMMDKVVSETDVFVFGSLICRDEISKSTLFHLLENAKYKVLDVNLRSPYYTIELLTDLMTEADFIKLNDEELLEINGKPDFTNISLEEQIKFLAEKTNTQQICVTKGALGAVLFYNDKFYYNEGYYIEVVDTVGAGDSFLASLIYKIVKEDLPQKALDYACAVGALVAGKEGANPEITDNVIKEFMMVP